MHDGGAERGGEPVRERRLAGPGRAVHDHEPRPAQPGLRRPDPGGQRADVGRHRGRGASGEGPRPQGGGPLGRALELLADAHRCGPAVRRRATRATPRRSAPRGPRGSGAARCRRGRRRTGPTARCRAPRTRARTRPASSCATRNGTPWRTSHSAMSVASEKPCGASSAIRPMSNRSVATMPANAGSRTVSGVDLVEHRLLVLLQVAVVRQRQALERGEQAGEVADEPAGLAAGELGDVGVLLLRHDARPRGVGVVAAGRSRTPWSPTG